MHPLPTIIQGGMGAGISDWRLARAVSSQGQLGVVSGTPLDMILARRLQAGDPGGHMRRALAQLPLADIAERICRQYYVAGGKLPTRPFLPLPMHTAEGRTALIELCIAGNFVEVFLAREGHGRPVGINYLEKIQLPHLPSLYGAMLAGVDYVLMGAGIPAKIPGVLDRLARHEPVSYPLTLVDAREGDEALLTFTPRDFAPASLSSHSSPSSHSSLPSSASLSSLPPSALPSSSLPPLRRPRFLAIVSSHVLAAALVKKANGTVDGFVVESPTAGGHNAPPRGKLRLSESGEPVYGERDVVDLEKMRALGLPFWLAGGYGTPEQLAAARAQGAAGVQVGTAFAFCEESGLRADYKAALIAQARAGTVRVSTDPYASPTSFPFKVAQLEGTVSDPAVYRARIRVCDLGYLREAYRAPDGTIGFRCAAEPVGAYVEKGGARADTVGRKCLCNALMANIALGQLRGRRVEPGIVTAGDDLAGVTRFLPPGATRYTAADVIAHLLDRRADHRDPLTASPTPSTATPPTSTRTAPPPPLAAASQRSRVASAVPPADQITPSASEE